LNEVRVAHGHYLVEYSTDRREIAAAFAYFEFVSPGSRQIANAFAYFEILSGRTEVETCGTEFVGQGTADGMSSPTFSDRATWDTHKAPEYHASDIDTETALYHLPTAESNGEIPVWDGDKWIVEDNLENPMTAYGDLIWGSEDGAVASLSIGVEGQILTIVAGRPRWSDPPAGGGEGMVESSAPDGIEGFAVTLEESLASV
jgi:hypothetical protein